MRSKDETPREHENGAKTKLSNKVAEGRWIDIACNYIQ